MMFNRFINIDDEEKNILKLTFRKQNIYLNSYMFKQNISRLFIFVEHLSN